jgi:hypothetical protein
MRIEGNLLKMSVVNSKPIQYSLMLGGSVIAMNDLIGREITLEYLQQYATSRYPSTALSYPVTQQTGKIVSISLDKTFKVRSTLAGIKGQYLLFENGEVINIRKHGGYKVILDY